MQARAESSRRIRALVEALDWVVGEYAGERVVRERVVLTWTEAMRSVVRWADIGKAPRRHDARSLSADLRSAVECLLRTGACGPRATRSAEQFILQLPDTINDQGLSLLLEAAQRLESHLLVEGAAEGLLRSAFTSRFPSVEDDDELYIWAKQLECLVAQRGHEPRWVLDSVRRILDDDLAEILNRRDPDQLRAEIASGRGLISRKANTSLEERLILASEAITAAPQSHDVIVWLYFDNAQDHQTPRQVGPIIFYDGRWWDAVVSEDPADSRLPDEVRNDPALLQGLPSQGSSDSHGYVLARIELGRRQLLDAVETARANVEAVATLSHFWGPSTWELWEGHIVVVDGRDGGWADFHPPHSSPGDRDPIRDDTSQTLNEVEQRLASHIPISDPKLGELLRIIHTVNDTRRSSPEVRLLASVRAIEFVAQSVNEDHWTTFLDIYKDAVGLWRLADEIVQVVVHAVRATSDDHRDRFLDLNARIIRHEGPLRFSVDIEEAVLALPELVELLGPEWTQRRRLDRLAELAQTPSLAADEAVLQANHLRVSVARAQRIRNALTHGGAAEMEALVTVDRLISRLAVQALHDGLTVAMEEGDAAAYLHRLSAHYDGIVQSLAAGEHLGSVLARRL